MAKGRGPSTPSTQSTRKLNVRDKDDGASGREYYLQPGQALKSNDYKYTSEVTKGSSGELPVDIKTESLYAEIDSSNRIFLLKNDSGERVECCGLPSGLASSFRRQITISTAKCGLQDNAVEVPSDNRDGEDLETHVKDEKLTAEPLTGELLRKKRRSFPVNASPTKRRRSTFHEQATSTKGSNGLENYEEVEGEDEEKEPEDEDEDEDEDDDGDFEGVTIEKRDVRVCDLDSAMEDIMRSLQQKGLKRILKVWLGKCHPQKQVRYPYNGGKIVEGMKKEEDPVYNNKNPGVLTAPDYWPSQSGWSGDKNNIGSGVRHKEPDHLLKNERTNLCKQLLRAGNRYEDAKFDLDKMEESTISVEKDHSGDFRPSARRLIDSLYYARRKEIEFEKGEIDADTVVYIDMKVPHTPKRRTRPYRKTKKIKISTPELDGFFDLGLPLKPSPSANSSFTSNFNKSIRIESGRTSPLPDGLPNATTSRSHEAMQMKGVDSRNSSRDSRLSRLASEGQMGAQHTAKSTPSPSEADTEVNEFDVATGPDEYLNNSPSQSMNICPSSQNEQGEQKPRVFTTPPFNHGLPGQFFPTSTNEQHESIVRSSPYMNPTTTTYLHFKPINNEDSSYCNKISPSPHGAYANSIHSTPHQPIAGSSALYSPYPPQPGPDNHIVAPPPQTSTQNPSFTVPTLPATHSVAAAPVSQPQALVTGYPSGASSDFNGAMPIDSEWHTVDMAYEHFRDGTYQMQQQRDGNTIPVVPSNHYHHPLAHGQHQIQDPKALNNVNIGHMGGVWAAEWEAMAHDPQRYCSMVPQPPPPQMQMQGMAPPAAVGPGVVVGNPGEMQRMGSGSGYAPSVGHRR